MRFEWDENKRLANIAKHGIDFRDVDLVVAHPVMVWQSPSPHEDRYLATGRLQGRFVTVIYTLRDEVYRSISMRRARRDERQKYQELHG